MVTGTIKRKNKHVDARDEKFVINKSRQELTLYSPKYLE